LIDEILFQQQKGDCLSPKERRLLLSDLFSTDTRTVIIDRHWWCRSSKERPSWRFDNAMPAKWRGQQSKRSM
jgi:hypothetical protein